MRVLNSMKIEADKVEVLVTLRENREKHQKIVQEARVGYLKAARKELEIRLKQLESGKIVALHFSLATPRDNTSVYDTAIEMLVLHQQKTVTLDSEQVRSLIQDQWDWTRDWIATNAQYSQTARAMRSDNDD